MFNIHISNLVSTKLASFLSSKVIFVILSVLTFTSCSVPGMMDPDNYGRNHEVYAVDFNPQDLNSISLYKMKEGDWSNMGKIKNNNTAKFQIEIQGDYLIVQANNNVMDVPTYQTWLTYARQQLGYTVDSEYDIFNTVEDGWIYEIDLKKFPLVEGSSHRLLMYERK